MVDGSMPLPSTNIVRINMTTQLDQIIEECATEFGITDDSSLRFLANKLLAEVDRILTVEQGSMNQRADHSKVLAKEIKWKLVEN